MRSAQLQQVPGLRDVLRGRAPVRVVARITLAEARQLPDQGNQGMPGAAESFGETLPIE